MLDTHDEAIAAMLSAIRQLMNPPAPKRRPIGLTANFDEKPKRQTPLHRPDRQQTRGLVQRAAGRLSYTQLIGFHFWALLVVTSLLRSEAQLGGYLDQLASFCWR